MQVSVRTAMRAGRAAERGHDENDEDQRSHPVSTREAAPCISSAKAKTSAANALSREENGRLRSSPIDGRLSRRQDTRPAAEHDAGAGKGDDRGDVVLADAVRGRENLAKLGIDRPGEAADHEAGPGHQFR